MKYSLNEAHFVISVKRAIQILRLYTPNRIELGIKEIANLLDLSTSTVHRYVKELEQEGFLIQNPFTKQYRLGFSVISLGGIIQSHQEIYEEANPILENLANRFHLPAHICVMEYNRVIYLLRAMGDAPTKLITKRGRFNDVHCTAEGLAILAFKSNPVIEDIINQPLREYTPYTITDPQELKTLIHQVRYDRFSITQDMFALGYISLAVPIQNYSGEVVSSLALIGDSNQIKDIQYEEVISELKNGAKEISMMLGYYED
ncbi:IclR family transcriptional regulator [Rummeliibacillus sp. NPDC094406]|uniref:IclR family transcriptional regulator n=1 Tax=Rummeliibacillus sp. NPDC094406 TaxID=3364511 RepID=UPI00380D971F